MRLFFAFLTLLASVCRSADFQVNTFTTGNQISAHRWVIHHGPPQTKIAFPMYRGPDSYGRVWDASTKTFDTAEIIIDDTAMDYGVFGSTSVSRFILAYEFAGSMRIAAKNGLLVDIAAEATVMSSVDATSDVYFTCSSTFCVVSTSTSGANSDIVATMLDADGVEVGSEFTVNTTTTGDQHKTRSAIRADNGDFIIVWQDQNPTPDALRGRRYDSSGAVQGAEFTITSVDAAAESSIESLTTGDWIVVWSEQGTADGSEKGVFGQRLDSVGADIGAEFQVNVLTLRDQGNPVVRGLSTGGFYVWWNSEQTAEGDYDVMGRQYNANCDAVSEEFMVNTYTVGLQGVPDAFRVSDSQFVVAFRGPDGDSYGVFANDFGNNPYGATPTPSACYCPGDKRSLDTARLAPCASGVCDKVVVPGNTPRRAP